MKKYIADKIIGSIAKYVGLVAGTAGLADFMIRGSSPEHLPNTLLLVGFSGLSYIYGNLMRSNTQEKELLDDLKNIGKLEEKVSEE